MIRVLYNTNNVEEYPNIGVARLRMMHVLHVSDGMIQPMEAAEVMGVTTGGVSVEMVLNLRVGFHPALGWLVGLDNKLSKDQIQQTP